MNISTSFCFALSCCFITSSSILFNLEIIFYQAIINKFENEVAQLKYDLAQNVHQQEVLINDIKEVLQPILMENNGLTAEEILNVGVAKDL